MTLVELLVVVTIVGILAAVAIPVFSRRVKEAGLAEATANVQGILEAEQAYFVRFQRYTPALRFCPKDPADPGVTQPWPELAGIDGECGAGWAMLGWSPDGPVAYQYRVFSAYNPTGDYAYPPTSGGAWSVAGPAPEGGTSGFGVDWVREFSPTDPQPWCAVEAMADTDGDGKPVYIRTNSYNSRQYRFPNPETGGDETY